MSYDKVKKEQQDELQTMKKNIERSFLYFKPNYDRFHEFQKFTFKTALTPSDEASLNTTGKPVIEFNITNAPISRQCGEFSKQEPSIEVSSQFGAPIDPQVIEIVDGHLRHILFESKKHNTQYNVYRDSLSGGFSDFKVWTDYADEMSFDQDIMFGRVFDPTMTGFDPMAREVDKSDAEYCFELILMDKTQFQHDYPEVKLDEVSFMKLEGAFNWSYKNQDQYVVVVADYYKKKRIKKKIVKLADEQVMLESDYPAFLEHFKKLKLVEQPPVVVDTRMSEFTTICRYRLMETEVIEYKETSFKYQPLVFVDGDSVIIQEDSSSTMEQFTKPYIYHAKGIQRLTNFTGQVIANDFENMVMHKFMIAEEALPTEEEAMNAWDNVQQASLMVWKSLYNDDPSQPLPKPEPVPRVPLPPEVLTTFNNSMAMLQNILGSYDASLSQNDNYMSEGAIVESATLSNAAAMPYVVNYMQSLNQVANIIVDLIPKYYKTPRTIPVMGKDGKRDYVKINGEGQPKLNYNSNALQVKVEAGVNFAIAKNKALQQITLLMKVSPEFAEFMNDVGLETLLDNIEFRNSDLLKSKVEAWKKQKEAKKKSEPDPEMLKAQAMQQQNQLAQGQLQLAQGQLQNEMKKTELKGEEISAKTSLETEKLILEKEKQDNERLSILQKAGESQAKLEAAVKKDEAEEFRAAADMHISAHKHGHEIAMDIAGHHHELNKHEHEKEQANKAETKKE